MAGLNPQKAYRKKLNDFISMKAPPAGLTVDDGIRYWQERLLSFFLFVGAFLGFFVYLPSVALCIKEDLWSAALADTIIYGWVVILYFCKSIPFAVRAISVSLISYLLGITLLLALGPFGGGPVWLFAFPVIVAILLDLRISLISLAVNAGTLIIVGILLKFGHMEWDYPVANPAEKWIVISLNFLLLNSIVTISIALISEGMQNLLKRQKSMLASLEKSEEKFRVLFEFAPDACYLSSLEGTLIDGNKTAEKLLGYNKEELIGKNFLELNLLPPEQLPKARELMSKNFEGKGTGPDEFILNRKNDENVLVEIGTRPIEIGGQKIVLGIVRDISERRRLEEQLHQAQKMEAIGMLAGGVAHDFNNILTSIIGNASLALMEIDKGDSLREEIEEIKAAGEKAAALTRQLLAFSRKQIIQPKVVGLNELLSGMEKMLGRLIGENIELVTILEPALWPVKADPGQIEQVIMNLTINSRDAMPKGGKLIIETANVDLNRNYFRNHGIKEEQPGPYVMLAVSDTGIGMDKETREHIFDPFYTTKETGKGTGLGLSTIYGVVRQSNGFVWVYSEPGRGSTFKVYLPRAEENVGAEEQERIPVGEPGGSETVLIVEDNDSLRRLARTVLKQKGYKVLEAENGEEALRVSNEHEGAIDLLVTDVVMPKKSGRETAERLQQIYPRMKVIYMSGYTDNAIVQHGVLEPGLNFIEKPFSPADLARKVREVLDKKQD